jgi:hypothetical protein
MLKSQQRSTSPHSLCHFKRFLPSTQIKTLKKLFCSKQFRSNNYVSSNAMRTTGPGKGVQIMKLPIVVMQDLSLEKGRMIDSEYVQKG